MNKTETAAYTNLKDAEASLRRRLGKEDAPSAPFFGGVGSYVAQGAIIVTVSAAIYHAFKETVGEAILIVGFLGLFSVSKEIFARARDLLRESERLAAEAAGAGGCEKSTATCRRLLLSLTTLRRAETLARISRTATWLYGVAALLGLAEFAQRTFVFTP